MQDELAGQVLYRTQVLYRHKDLSSDHQQMSVIPALGTETGGCLGLAQLGNLAELMFSERSSFKQKGKKPLNIDLWPPQRGVHCAHVRP